MKKTGISSSGSALMYVPQRCVTDSWIDSLCGWTPVPMNGWASHHPVVTRHLIPSYLPPEAGVRARWTADRPVESVSLGVAQIPPHEAE